MWKRKNKQETNNSKSNKSKQTHGKRDQIRGYQKWRVWGKGVLKEGGQKVQTSGYKK